MSRNTINLKYVRNNKISNCLGPVWKTGGRLIIEDNRIILRTWFKSITFDIDCHIIRQSKEELLRSVIVNISDADYDYSVLLSPRNYNRLLSLTKKK